MLSALAVVFSVVAPTLGTRPSSTAAAATLPRVSLMGQSQLTGAELARYYRSVNHLPYRASNIGIDDLANLFVSEGNRYNVRGDVAFAQSIVETAWFNFPDYGQVKPWNNNYSGYGACDSCDDGYQFSSPLAGVRSQIQLLRNYGDAGSRAANLPDPLVPEAWGSNPTVAARNFDTHPHKGRAPYWNDMGNGNWATSTTYATTVLTVYSQMLAFFGRTLAPETIAEHYAALGGSGGLLGNPLAAEENVAGGKMRRYQGGNIYWTAAFGAYEVYGAILDRYVVMGGPASPLGFPTTGEASAPGDGRMNLFQGGGIYWTPAVENAHATYGEIGRLYQAMGGPGSPLGFPLTDEATTPGGAGRFNDFQGGSIYWSFATGVHEVHGEIARKYREFGGPTSFLGLPTGDERGVPGGRASAFQGGEIFWSPQSGAHEVHGAIAWLYSVMGGPASGHGFPVRDEAATPGGVGRFNAFQGGEIYWSPSTGVQEVHGAIRDLYQSLGGPGSFLGFPVSGERGVPGGRASAFQGGEIFWSPSTGPREVHGAILDVYLFFGGPGSFLGFPVTSETATPDGTGRYNHFQGGSVYWSWSTGAHEVHGAIRDFWAGSGWERGPLGYPVTSELPTPDGGRVSGFQGGAVTWTPAAGAFRS